MTRVKLLDLKKRIPYDSLRRYCADISQCISTNVKESKRLENHGVLDLSVEYQDSVRCPKVPKEMLHQDYIADRNNFNVEYAKTKELVDETMLENLVNYIKNITSSQEIIEIVEEKIVRCLTSVRNLDDIFKVINSYRLAPLVYTSKFKKGSIHNIDTYFEIKIMNHLLKVARKEMDYISISIKQLEQLKDLVK